jgi:hypothetical protein
MRQHRRTSLGVLTERAELLFLATQLWILIAQCGTDSLRWGWRQRQPVCLQDFPLRSQFDGILANLHGGLTLCCSDTSMSVI